MNLLFYTGISKFPYYTSNSMSGTNKHWTLKGHFHRVSLMCYYIFSFIFQDGYLQYEHRNDLANLSVVPVLCKFAKTTTQVNQSAYKYLHSVQLWKKYNKSLHCNKKDCMLRDDTSKELEAQCVIPIHTHFLLMANALLVVMIPTVASARQNK